MLQLIMFFWREKRDGHLTKRKTINSSNGISNFVQSSSLRTTNFKEIKNLPKKFLHENGNDDNNSRMAFTSNFNAGL